MTSPPAEIQKPAPGSDPHDDEALFKCSEGCGTRTRASCTARYGHLTCPRCLGRGTLKFVPTIIANPAN